jgi:non-heme Fe2+,alpha-ketoglutarate-dependent halogenase
MQEICYKIEREVLGTTSAIYGFDTGRDRHLESRVLYDLVANPAVKERLAQLLGPDLLVWRSNFFFKPPGAPETVWHKENLFKEFVEHPILEPPDPEALFQVTPWIAIDEATIESGCVQLVAGSHKILPTGNTVEAKEESDRKQQSFGHDQKGFLVIISSSTLKSIRARLSAWSMNLVSFSFSISQPYMVHRLTSRRRGAWT